MPDMPVLGSAFFEFFDFAAPPSLVLGQGFPKEHLYRQLVAGTEVFFDLIRSVDE
jgi:hypothetical protein